MRVSTQRTVRDLVLENPEATRVFENVGIDYCCGGGKSLEAACAAANLSVDELIDSLELAEEAARTKQKNRNWQIEPLADLVAQGRRADAVRTFMRTVGVPAPVVLLMPLMPAWKRMTAVAHTLPYDLSIVIGHQQGQPLPVGYYAQVTSETLVIAGGKSPTYMRNAQAAIARAVPHARLETLPGQTHMIKPKVVAPVLTAFLRQ